MARPTKREATNKKIAAAVTKMTPETIGKLEQAFSIDATIAEACFYADINPDTYYEWVKKNPELSERFKALRNKPVLKARQTITNHLDQVGNAQWYIERKRGDEFGPKSKVEHSGSVAHTDGIVAAEDAAAIRTFHETLKANMLRRSMDKAKKDGEI